MTMSSIEAFFGVATPDSNGGAISSGSDTDSVSAFTSKGDVMNALAAHAQSLVSIRLAQPMTALPQAMKDFRRERVLFNEVPFIPDKSDSHRNIAFALTLREYIRRVRLQHADCDLSYRKGASAGADAQPQPQPQPQPQSAAADADAERLDLAGMSSDDIILQRACRTSAGSDSFFMVQRLFATVQGTFVTQRTNILGFVPFVNGEPPVEVAVHVQPVGGHVCRQGVKHLGVHLSKSSIGSCSADMDVSSASGGSEEVVEEGALAASSASATATASAPSSPSHSPTPTPRGSGRVGNAPAAAVAAAAAEPLESLFPPATATAQGSDANPLPLPLPPSLPLPSVELVARIKISNSFAIYDEDIIDLIAGEPETDPPPWLELETVIVDDLNFRTGEQLRVLQVQVHCPATGQYFPPLEASLPRPGPLSGPLSGHGHRQASREAR
jgi:hypothetical protein